MRPPHEFIRRFLCTCCPKASTAFATMGSSPTPPRQTIATAAHSSMCPACRRSTRSRISRWRRHARCSAMPPLRRSHDRHRGVRARLPARWRPPRAGSTRHEPHVLHAPPSRPSALAPRGPRSFSTRFTAIHAPQRPLMPFKLSGSFSLLVSLPGRAGSPRSKLPAPSNQPSLQIAIAPPLGGANLECSGRSPTAWRTGQDDPKATFRFEAMNGRKALESGPRPNALVGRTPVIHW